MKKSLLLTLLLAFMFALISDADAQRRRNPYGYKKKNNSKRYSNYRGGKVGYGGIGNPKYWTVGASVDMVSYFGDISKYNTKVSGDYNFIPNGFGITASKVLYPGIHFRGGFNYGTFSTSDYSTGNSNPDSDPNDYGRWQRNYHFKNSVKELNAGLEIDFIPNKRGARGRFPINPYVYVGAAVFHHNPKARAPGATVDTDGDGNPDAAVDQAGNILDVKPREWVELQPLGTEGQKSDSTNLSPYPRIQFAIPAAAGVKIKLARNLDVNFEIGFRFTFTDYLDDIGGNYADLDYFGSNHLARAMSERGAEPIAALEGEPRDVPVTTQNVQLNTANADLNWTGGDSYTHGWNYIPGKDRADSKFNDIYITSQIRIVYIFDKKTATRAKFR
ncbi:DUF6089 family protein [Reichenbachiella ulvae]|uniref:DUF6089 family protein n=1 Tax=Reichenbachiella ulvae TaxID=2980104 RepID=A0ABT3CXV9_9BACT|nr:DUF6089 family protein [Reichenbachiella ulvae]MCV9388527.1 DUF6089 family protein [Reichenbachiella ulvae]